MAAVDELDGFIDKFDPDVAVSVRAALAKMRKRLPGAFELVYDNYNALAIGFASSERSSEAVFSIAVFPKWVTLCFLWGKGLPDPLGLLRGEGSQVRSVRLTDAKDLDSPAIKELMNAALAERPIPKSSGGRLIIKSISAKQRPRRVVRAQPSGK